MMLKNVIFSPISFIAQTLKSKFKSKKVPQPSRRYTFKKLVVVIACIGTGILILRVAIQYASAFTNIETPELKTKMIPNFMPPIDAPHDLIEVNISERRLIPYETPKNIIPYETPKNIIPYETPKNITPYNDFEPPMFDFHDQFPEKHLCKPRILQDYRAGFIKKTSKFMEYLEKGRNFFTNPKYEPIRSFGTLISTLYAIKSLSLASFKTIETHPWRIFIALKKFSIVGKMKQNVIFSGISICMIALAHNYDTYKPNKNFQSSILIEVLVVINYIVLKFVMK